MQRALRLAERGRGSVEPNPVVGCVLVRDGRVLAEGWHQRFGGPHAEIVALARCRESPRGATAYVTLEPCCHHGKTPPCTRALIEAGVARVVAATVDPNPAVCGGGLRELRRAGIDVRLGVCEPQALASNGPFFKRVRRQLPWVILKWAQSLDGSVATRRRDSQWISDEVCRAHAHRIRAKLDAIVVGVGTVIQDDPLLTSRVGRTRRIATRIVLDPQLRTPVSSQLFRTAREVRTWVVASKRAPKRRAARLERAGVRVLALPLRRDGLPLLPLLRQLVEAGMTNVLVEGGAETIGRFLDQRLADELHVYIAPRLIGGRDALGAIGGVGPARVRDALALPETAELRRMGNGWFLRAVLTAIEPSAAPRRYRGTPGTTPE